MQDSQPQKYRDWLNNRFSEELEEEEPEPTGSEESEAEADDGYPLHDDYSEESEP